MSASGGKNSISWGSTVEEKQRPSSFNLNKGKSIRQQITFSGRRFDVKTLPADLHRVYKKLKADFGEDYALTFVFIFRTGMELHRAWHMTLLTSKILQQLKDKFDMRMTWELGVIKLKFRVEDGGYELHRKVPYDYDSEFQDLYMKIAVAYLDGHITVHQALLFQSETKHGKHTAKSGLFLRDFPGRLVLYPLEAATCAVIFFGGDWYDAGVAAVTGIATGLVEYLLTTIGGSAKGLIDISAGVTTGLIAGLFYNYGGQQTCLPAVFLGTLYWFFYGTAFVLGILEIVSGELETGVVRFMAVAVKTFVLTLGTVFGMQLVMSTPINAWQDQDGNCGNIDLDVQWWRVPLYVACSASALGQYRFPINVYWRGLAVQVVGYEVQYRLFKMFALTHDKDLLDTACSNLVGAMAAVVFASMLSFVVDRLGYYYHARVLQRHKGAFSTFGEFMFTLSVMYIRFSNWIGFGKSNDMVYLAMTKKLQQQSEELNDENNMRSEIRLTEEEEVVLLEAVVQAENLNIWALLMPTVYQLVPGSLIAKLWFNAVFPPPLESEMKAIDGSDLMYSSVKPDQAESAVFQSLMVVATSLALGLLVGFGIVEYGTWFLGKIFCCFDKVVTTSIKGTDSIRSVIHRQKSRKNFHYTCDEDDPDSDSDGEADGIVVAEHECTPDEEDVKVLSSLIGGDELGTSHLVEKDKISEADGDSDAMLPNTEKEEHVKLN
jgi:hypothetical protein